MAKQKKTELPKPTLLDLIKQQVWIKRIYNRHNTSKHRPGRSSFQIGKIRKKRKLERQNKKKGRR